MTASRILTVLAAILLVASFALATLSTPDMPLAQALLQFDPASLAWLHQTFTAALSERAWLEAVTPILIRPAWLAPAMAGIVCCGLALSLRPKARPTPRRRRN